VRHSAPRLPSYGRWRTDPAARATGGLSFDGLAVWLRRSARRARDRIVEAIDVVKQVCRSSQVNTLGFCVVVTRAGAEFEL